MNIIISNTRKEPIYEQIKEQIQLHILNDRVKEGELLPSIRQLAKDLRISVITTKKAYEHLERDGYIITVVGKGSFVSHNIKTTLKEKQFHIINEKMNAIVKKSKELGVDLSTLQQMLTRSYEEE